MNKLRSTPKLQYGSFLRILIFCSYLAGSLGIQSQTQEKDSKKLKKTADYLRTSGLIPGDYEVDGTQSDKCLEGELRLIASEGTQTLMVGARGLVFGLGADKPEKSQDGDCQLAFMAKVEANKISGWQEETCKKSPVRRYETEITPVKDGLVYKRKLLADKKESEVLTCRLKLVKNASH